MENDKPLVSIVIPAYNGANYLKEAIDSALIQTYPNCEVLVINDGSTDQGRTEAIAKGYGDSIRYFQKENGGVASALNMGIREMRGEYFSWLSHDDWYAPEKIEKQITAILESGDRTTLVQAEYAFYNDATGAKTNTDFLHYYRQEQLTNSFFSVLQLQIHACSALIHRSHFERVGVFDERLKTIQDIDLWFRIFRGQRSIFLPDVLHTVREHREAGSNVISCYYTETRNEYSKLIDCMGTNEMEEVFGDAGIFLCRMAGFLRSYGGVESVKRLEMRMKQLPQKNREVNDLISFKEKLKQLSGKKASKVVIFGSGQYGIRLKYDLESRLIRPQYFVDNDKQKHGRIIDGIPCKSMEAFLQEKEEALVIVAMRNYQRAAGELKKKQVPYFVTRQELDPIFLKTVPALSKKELWLKS